ncbi:Monocarboxylate transporter 12 like protein [Argiope bruennichi]|uniref:Monocarboxylate transporter 12 like protein n=1 Tax=Argiope bruennichi TaxID=94029 RepID=A0A8T0E4E4_ARGBR|nr:Monocarboxylate transporter 12 like protein [Argiope bruennichi]
MARAINLRNPLFETRLHCVLQRVENGDQKIAVSTKSVSRLFELQMEYPFHHFVRGDAGDQNLNFVTTKSKNIPDVEEIKTLLNGEDKERTTKSIKAVRFSCSEDQNNERNFENEESNLIDNSENVEIVRSNNQPMTSQTMIINPNYTINGQSESTSDPNGTKYIPSEQPTEDIMSDGEEPHHYGKLQFIDNKAEYDPQINLHTIYVPTTSSSHVSQGSSHTILKPINISNGHIHLPHEVKRKWLTGLMEPAKAAYEIVKNPMFLIIASNYSIFFLSYMTYLTVIVDYTLDLGIDRTDCVFLVSTFSIADLAGRLGSGWITDSGTVKRKHLMMVNMVTFGSLLAATSLTDTYIAITALSVSSGLIVGINLILFYALLEEYLGLSKLPMAIGLMNFSIGVVSLVTPLLTGYFRDTMGSYDHLFHLLGGVCIFCGLLWAFEPLIVRNKEKNGIKKGLPA